MTMPWAERPLRELAARIFVGIASAATHAYRESGVLLLRNLNIKEGGIDRSDLIYIDPHYEAQHARKRLKAGDVLTVRTGYAGVSAVLPDDLVDAQCFTALVTRPNEKVLDSNFLALFLNSPIGEKAFTKSQAGGSQKNVNAGALEQLLVPTPPLDEQRRIAAALSAWDAAIQKTEQLIAAKEQRYSALITRLITSRSKSESWPHNSIRDIADRVQRQGDGSDYPLLTISSASGFVRQEDRYSRYMAGESAKTYTLLRAGEFSYNKGNSKRYEFGCVFQLRGYEAALVPSIYVSFKLRESVCAAYMRHLFAADYLKPQLRALVKTGVRNNGLLNISPDEFLSTTVPLPPLNQQTQIAKVLDAAGADIDLLKQQLAALRVQKRGLMQKLLTGQWRLPIPKENEVPVNG